MDWNWNQKAALIVHSSCLSFSPLFSPFPPPFFLGQILKEFRLAGIAQHYYTAGGS